MHQLIIHKLGPIQHCELSIKNYTILTGYQASGKSTIAKAIYFFRTLKEDIFQLILRRSFSQAESEEKRSSLRGDFESATRNKFLSTFGTSYSMERDMKVTYHYAEGIEVSVCLTESPDFLSPNYVWVDYSQSIRDLLNKYDRHLEHEQLRQELADLFGDPYETVYIPAGRSILTLLGGQFNYIYSTMDDAQKRLLDSCTRDYMERVLKLRPQFANGLEGLLEGKQIPPARRVLYREAIKLIQKILKGKYSVTDGEERIWLDTGRYVKINFASSGQQECVWILNLLYYYFVMQNPVFFIIEEPESNLFPESQKAIVELAALVAGTGNAVLLTTHSPYVLGAVNNLLYAGTVGQVAAEKSAEIIAPEKWIDARRCEARFVENGEAVDCMDRELMQIDNSLLDQISHGINREYDILFEIEQNAKMQQKNGEE
ncbi:MAG TPA: AAA family ATPase [Candidatus Eisenbergiella intestinipullorum]|nr:AAA family ATPase [Candidatus Eisenbergiella intestinipullorum]